MNAAHGQLWQPKEGGATWRVAGVRAGVVALTGPGPCRGMKDVTIEDLLREWLPAGEGRKKGKP